MSSTKYVCDDCGREIDRGELENSPRIRCPDCGSYEIRKAKEE